jgi:hypothetical protein
MFLKIDSDQKKFIDEVAALSGLQKDVIRECWEFSLIRWAEQIVKNPDSFSDLIIPFLGRIKIKYDKDVILPSGEMTTEVMSFHSISDSFKKMVGDLHDEGPSLITDLLKKKIENAILTSSTTKD